ncbi:MAG TPA: hypothetical protein VNN08_24930 [Thermoanaerobaculia bacterium]|nr:hypothetical protein [Thermoanaerobaculia bacterium]
MTPNAAVDRPKARWLPSRHRFALARLIAYIGLRLDRPTARQPEHLVLPINRDQTAAEMHCVAVWVLATTACYVAAALPLRLPWSIAVAVPLAAIAIHLPIVIGGPVVRLLIGDGNHIGIISVITMALLLIASSYAVTTASWARFAAWLFFGVVAVNCAAAAVLWLLRHAIQAEEERCVR